MSDELELQEILQNSPDTPRPKPSASNLSLVWGVPSETKEEKPKVPSEYSQWAIFPNGVYAAIGSTQINLPVGAYSLTVVNGTVYFVEKKMVTDTLIDLGNSNSLKVIDGIKLFWTRKQKFLDKGIIFKRGILMWGPPGSGKTATLILLINDLVKQGGIVLLVKSPTAAVQALS